MDVWLHNKCLRHSMNRIQSKNHNKISLSCFDDEIYILNNGNIGLAFGYCFGYSDKLFVKPQKYHFNFRSCQNRFFLFM